MWEIAETDSRRLPMAHLCDSVLDSGVADLLFVNTSMHDLLVADREPENWTGAGVVQVHLLPDLVRIHHLSTTGRREQIDADPERIVGLFWRFVMEKFGIRPMGRTGVGG
ncbi:hypothetical protein Lesp02_18350 [Lentzea sp. NBRC 105346]|nr:hypothetical protein Lesp02_18350 [Lentzea sp. NBRC 105346]